MILRLLNWQGIAGLAATLGIGLLLIAQKIETARWKKQSASFDQLYREQQSALATTVANARAAADQARAADHANAERVTAEQRTINERTANDFEARLAAARSDAQRLRLEPQTAADPGTRGNAPVPSIPASSDGPAEGAGQNGLPSSDALTATEQAIQLDQLIKWVRAQGAVDSNPSH